MLKTLEKNSASQKSGSTLKQWKVSATGWFFPPSSETEETISRKVVVSSILTVILILIVGISFLEYVKDVMLDGVTTAISIIMQTGDLPPELLAGVTARILRAQIIGYCFIALVSFLIAFLSARLTLKPIRETVRMQREFLASVAHELRTPLAIMKTQNEVALLETKASSPLVETFEDTIHEINHMTEILNNLLLFNRVDTRESITFGMVDLGQILGTVTERIRTKGAEKGVRVIYIAHDIPFVYGNATGLEQAFYNLMKNGVTYTESGGEVSIECVTTTDKQVMVRVKDTGVGIHAEELRHIFEPFYRTDTALEMSKGTGLGLSIVFEIIKLHRGKIKVQSIVDEGTSFDVTLPQLAVGSPAQIPNSYDFTKRAS